MNEKINVEIFISCQARERAVKDKFIKSNKKDYSKEIEMLRLTGTSRPSETIGNFLVSPRGNKKIRIAWHFAYNQKTDTLVIYVDDLLYHITDNYYVDKWNEKARLGKINLSSYSDYTIWAGF